MLNVLRDERQARKKAKASCVGLVRSSTAQSTEPLRKHSHASALDRAVSGVQPALPRIEPRILSVVLLRQKSSTPTPSRSRTLFIAASLTARPSLIVGILVHDMSFAYVKKIPIQAIFMHHLSTCALGSIRNSFPHY
jgi:hypothetical protein